jgi:hypothetical protein
MRISLVVASALACAASVGLAMWLFDWSFGKAAVLAPVIVVSFGAVAGLVVFWTRIALEPLLHRRGAQE